MNALDLVGLVKARVPGYSTAEYLRELNAVYIEDLYEECKNLENSYFQNTVVLTVAVEQSEFDLLNNQDNGLSAAVDSRFAGEITNLRVKAPNGSSFTPGDPIPITDPAWQAEAAPYPQTAITGPPYRYNVYDRATLRFPRPLAVGTTLEITYVYELLPLRILASGTVSSVGTAITGTGTNFTQLVAPDFQTNLPGTDIQSEIDAELQVASAGAGLVLPFAVKQINVTSSAPGIFSVAHGLGVAPVGLEILMTSGGSIWAQTPASDATNLYLVASDTGLTATVTVYLGAGSQIVISADPLNYRVVSIADDTHLTLFSTPNPALVNASFAIASVPQFPSSLHYVLATCATANLFSTPAEDDRYLIWEAKAEKARERFKNSILVRQHQKNPRKGRFSYPSYGRMRVVS